MSDKATPRDKAWLAVIDYLSDGSSMTVADIATVANVSTDTARAVLHVAENFELLSRDKPQAHTYHPNIGAFAHVDDPEYQRAIATLVAEANREV